MSLGTEEAAFNAAMLAAAVTWDALVKTKSPGDRIYLVAPKQWAGTAAGVAGATVLAKFTTNPKLQNRVIFEIDKATDAASIKWFLPGMDIGGVPMFLLVTDSAGALT